MIEKKEVSIPCLIYFYLHSKLRVYSKNDVMKVSEMKWRMAFWRIPRALQPFILREMELLDLIKKKNNQIVIFKNPVIDIENLVSLREKLSLSN